MDKRKKITISSLIIILVIFSVGVLILNSGIKKKALRPTGGNTFAKAVVTKVITSNVNISDEGEMEGNQTVKIRITSGKYKNEECEAQSPYANHTGAFCKKGTHVIILVKKLDNGEFNASVYNYDRGIVQWIMIAAFLGVLCIVGGRRGVASAVGLVFTFVCIIGVYIPMLYIGVSPFISATITTIMITIVVMMLIGGWTIKTLCAILGTIAGVLVSGGMAYLFGKLGHISGLNADDVETLAYVAQNSKLDVGGVLFSGILIASLGAVMDVSMSISSTIAEIHDVNPEFDARRLFKSGINVGKDMMGTMSNTLILAFAGGSINILIITYAYNMSYLEYFNKYDIGIELLRGIAGSMGVILTVPFVSIIASILLKKKNKKIL